MFHFCRIRIRNKSGSVKKSSESGFTALLLYSITIFFILYLLFFSFRPAADLSRCLFKSLKGKKSAARSRITHGPIGMHTVYRA